MSVAAGVPDSMWSEEHELRKGTCLIQAVKPPAKTHCQVHNEMEATTLQRCQHSHQPLLLTVHGL